ncbi:MAG: N-formylglutamate amidohydrolase [Gammaproteobacteria bacterium]|nr:N-formylglutamate amidohydrolase [Gammaproteobacteria bacterium]
MATSDELKTGWDAFVDELWAPSIEVGASLLAAKFSRMYIDPNRAESDIDTDLIAGNWPGKIKPTEYTARGMGLLRRFALPGKPMYADPLSVQEVEKRLANYYRPYHQCLKELLDTFHDNFGAVWHVDCHSMKSKGNQMNIDAGEPRADIVLGDADGKTADAEFTDYIRQAFSALGYHVAVNYPYKGGYCVHAYGDPSAQRHSVQIEINRALYMNEADFTRNDNFTAFQRDLFSISKQIAAYIKDRL